MSSKTLTNIADIAYESSIDEFKKVLSGFDSDFDKLTAQTVGLGNFDIGKKISNSLSDSDARTLNKLIGTISGGYYLNDMMRGKALETSAIITGIKDALGSIAGEIISNGDIENEPFYFYHDSAQKARFRKSKNIKQTVKENGLRVGNYDGYDFDKQNIINPSLGAVEFKRHTLSLAKRYGDALSLFFNCISNVDMSLCAPYLDVKILVPKNDTSKKSLGHDVQFRFIQQKSDKNFISKAIDTINPLNNSNKEEELYDTHGMELFLSPQTLSNSNIRKQDKNILEPNNTLLTLKNCDISIAGLGVGLFCSKNAKISMTLHDRSRLRDIAPLITPKQFARSRVIIEYGWSHPQGGMTSNNTVGKFLNSLRDKGVFIVKGSSFSFTDGGHVDINVDLAMMGGSDSILASVASGHYVQANVFKNQIKDAIEILKEEQTEAIGAANIIPEKSLKISNAAGSNTLMKRSDYTSIIEDVTKGDKASVTRALKNFVKTLDSEQSNDVKDAISDKFSELPRFGVNQIDPFLLNGNDASYMIAVENASIPDDIPAFTSLGSVLMSFVAFPIQATHQFDEVQMFFYPMNQSSAGGYIHTTASFPICIEELKHVFKSDDQSNISSLNNMSVAKFMKRLESKIIRNPVYKHYGLNSEYKLINAIKSITDQLVLDYYDEEIDEDERNFDAIEMFLNADPNNKVAFDSIVNNINAEKKLQEQFTSGEIDKAGLAYGRDALIKKDAFTSESLRQSLMNIVNKDIKSTLNQIYTRYGVDSYVKDDNYSYSGESKFCMPNISYFFETISPHDNDVTSFKDIKEKFLRSNSVINENKSILRIHVYDEEAIASKTQELMLSICNSRKVIDSISKSKLEIYENYRNRKSKGLDTKIFGNNKITKTIGDTIINNLDFNEVKDIIKQTMPSITIGSNFSNVKSFTANSTTSGEISNVLFITEQMNQKKLGTNSSTLPALDSMNDLTVVPAVGSLNCPGMPLIQRGQQVFIDAGTGTSIDAIYTVQSVNHSISQGGFNTTARLMYSGQNRVESIREMVDKLVNDKESGNIESIVESGKKLFNRN